MGSERSGHERSLLRAIFARLPAAGPQMIAGPGDDAAVVHGRPVCVTSVDAIVEGVHFELGEGRYSCHDVGCKALASALSDLAAMGVSPGEAYIVLAVPAGFSEQDALALADGAGEVAAATGTTIAGGDVVRAQQLSVSVTVVGWAESAAAPVYRSGAAPGDIVGVTGTLGAAGAGLAVMQQRVSLERSIAGGLLARARRPRPRITEGRSLALAGARAMIDLSDGLAGDAAHVGHASETTLEIDLALLPLAEGVAEAASQLGVEPWRLAACAGEDYELCVCVAPAERLRVERALQQAGGVGVTWIGEVLPSPADGPGGARFALDGVEVALEGFEHSW
ncbi:MAG TPA: thiamine-phosphate kinase [Solirubrobacteraceae bacterium]|jgi:thiamine-monophosphate kinase